MSYQPKRASSRWMEGAPPYVLSVHDYGPQANDRYTVCFGWPLWQPSMARQIPCLGFNECPTSPNMGISQWGETPAHRISCGAKIRWLDLPEDLRKHVIGRVEGEPDPVLLVRLEPDPSPDPDQCWLLLAVDGRGGYGPNFKTKAAARRWAKKNLMILVEG